MVLTLTMQRMLLRYQTEIDTALRCAVTEVSQSTPHAGENDLEGYYGQMQYHLGWVDASFVPTQSNPGKYLRSTLLLLAYEMAGAWGLAEKAENTNYLDRALPAAAAIELIHNFTIIHDDIADGDTERRHRPTLWKIWGIPQATNTGDGLFALGRLILWKLLDKGVDAETIVHLATLLDHTCLTLSEGQHLDMCFEEYKNVTIAMYLDMISRKTAALMSCAAEMGAALGTRNQETIEYLRRLGYELGIAFQVRDDVLGVWSSMAEFGKTPAGDIYRRKGSLPVIHALEHASESDRQYLRTVYQQKKTVTGQQVESVLAIFQRTQTQAYCRTFLVEQCQRVHLALTSIPQNSSPTTGRAYDDIKALIDFVELIGKA